MITIKIDTATLDASEMQELLTHISFQIGQGYTSGIYPNWTLEETVD